MCYMGLKGSLGSTFPQALASLLNGEAPLLLLLPYFLALLGHLSLPLDWTVFGLSCAHHGESSRLMPELHGNRAKKALAPPTTSR